MRKITATILSLLLSTVALSPAITQSLGRERSLRTANASTPTAPLSMATAAQRTAVACDSTLFLCNQADGVWQEYAHVAPIVKLAFDGDVLYFLDKQNDLYTLSATALQTGTLAEKTALRCDTFTLSDGVFYYANVGIDYAAFHALPSDDLTAQPTSLTLEAYTPAFTVYDGAIYAVDGAATLHKLPLDGSAATQLAQLPTQTNDLTVTKNGLFCTTKAGDFYRYDLANLQAAPFTAMGDYAALSATDDGVYLFNGNTPQAYTQATESFDTPTQFLLPKTDGINAKNLPSAIAAGNVDFKIVKTGANALLLQTDLQTAQDNAPFPFAKSVRFTEEKTALQLGTVDGYALLAYRETPATAYQSYLVKESHLSEQTEHVQTYAQPKTGVTSNQIGLYKLPYLGLTAAQSAQSGQMLTILGEVTGLDVNYYAVQTEDGVFYLPQAYVSATNGAPPQKSEEIAGEKGRDTDAIWRLAYLLLGAGAIGILADFLILRKKRQD